MAAVQCVHDIHIPPARPDAVPLEWTAYDGSPFRSRDASCMLCSPDLIYELGTIGGALRIRRTEVTARKVRITPAQTRQKVAWGWWLGLRSGTAR